MKLAGLLVAWLALTGGERERGLQLYHDGKFAEAAAAFRAAIAHDGDSAELQWNLALASWRAGDLAAAETAAEKYAAMAKNARVDLHAGLLGAFRHDEAKALEAQVGSPPATAGGEPAPDPLPLLEQALQKATQARDHFVRGASANASAELLRNTERSLRLIEALEQKIEELKKQREQQPKDESQPNDEKQDDDRKNDRKNDQKQDPKQEQPKPESEESKPDESKPESQPQGEGEEKPEPEPSASKPEAGQEPPQPGQQDQPGEGKPDDRPADKPSGDGKRQDAPGEAAEGKELTPEQAQRLLEQLRELDKKQQAIRARTKTGRRAVERDW
jgi:tetratricopeptide (TPR) repeat protein